MQELRKPDEPTKQMNPQKKAHQTKKKKKKKIIFLVFRNSLEFLHTDVKNKYTEFRTAIRIKL